MQQQATASIPAAAPAARFLDAGDGTVTDTNTGLQWSKATLTPKCVTHADAEKACADLPLAGHTDWRLPTRAELLTLVDDTRVNPAIDTAAFPDTKSDWYWTSTRLASSPGYAWIVHFFNGNASYGYRDDGSALARAVRSVAPGQ
jgi:hypothetical protein